MDQVFKNFILGVFDDEQKVLQAIRRVRKSGVAIHDVFTPYAVHGLDEAMGLKPSRLPIVCFIAAALGLILAVGFQSWVFTSSWPINIGGKPFFAMPAFVPVCFEMTVLIGGLVSVAAFFIRSRLYPGAKPLLFNTGITDNRFVLAVEEGDAGVNAVLLRDLLLQCGACEVCEKEVTS